VRAFVSQVHIGENLAAELFLFEPSAEAKPATEGESVE
jgi:hypothetical protein